MTATLTAPAPAPTGELPGGSGVGGQTAPWWMPTMTRTEEQQPGRPGAGFLDDLNAAPADGRLSS